MREVTSKLTCILAHRCSLIVLIRAQGCHSRKQRGPYANEADLNFTPLFCSVDNRGKFCRVDKTALTVFFWGTVIKPLTSSAVSGKMKNSNRELTEKKKILCSRMKVEMQGHVKGLATFNSKRNV